MFGKGEVHSHHIQNGRIRFCLLLNNSSTHTIQTFSFESFFLKQIVKTHFSFSVSNTEELVRLTKTKLTVDCKMNHSLQYIIAQSSRQDYPLVFRHWCSWKLIILEDGQPRRRKDWRKWIGWKMDRLLTTGKKVGFFCKSRMKETKRRGKIY